VRARAPHPDREPRERTDRDKAALTAAREDRAASVRAARRFHPRKSRHVHAHRPHGPGRAPRCRGRLFGVSAVFPTREELAHRTRQSPNICGCHGPSSSVTFSQRYWVRVARPRRRVRQGSALRLGHVA
jgi:hypothetical protein